MTTTTSTRLKVAAAFLSGVLTITTVFASGLIDVGRHAANHEILTQHLIETKPLTERFILTEQSVKDINASLDQLVAEVKGLRRDLDRREANGR